MLTDSQRICKDMACLPQNARIRGGGNPCKLYGSQLVPPGATRRVMAGQAAE